MTGRITSIVSEKGFGFVRGSDNVDRFFHAKSNPEFPTLRIGDFVEFEPSVDEKRQAGKNARATGVRRIQPAGAAKTAAQA